MSWSSDTSLQTRHSFAIKSHALRIMDIRSEPDLYELSSTSKDLQLPYLVIGGGTNSIFVHDYPGIVACNKIKHLHHSRSGLFSVGSGVELDRLVQVSVEHGWHGLAELSYIPGTVGGAISLNSSAFGRCVHDFLIAITLFDPTTKHFYSLGRDQLKHAEHKQIFAGKKQPIITGATFALSRNYQPTNHPKLNCETYTPAELREIVLSLRRHLPDPSLTPNVGSFFKNPVIDGKQLQKLLETEKNLPYRRVAKKFEIPAGWLLDRLGYRSKTYGDYKFSDSHANILLASKNADAAQLLRLVKKVQTDVSKRFGISIYPEPKLI